MYIKGVYNMSRFWNCDRGAHTSQRRRRRQTIRLLWGYGNETYDVVIWQKYSQSYCAGEKNEISSYTRALYLRTNASIINNVLHILKGKEFKNAWKWCVNDARTLQIIKLHIKVRAFKMCVFITKCYSSCKCVLICEDAGKLFIFIMSKSK